MARSVAAVLCLGLAARAAGQRGLEDLAAGLRGLNGGAGGGDECALTCPPGEKLAPLDADFRPYANGCSVPSFIVLEKDYSFVSGCNAHDACYMACGVAKADCESRFGRALQALCRKHHRDELGGCMQMASIFTAGVSMFGCGGFIASQEEGCGCVPEAESLDRYRAYVTRFFEKYNPEKLAEQPDMARELLEGEKWKGREGELVASLYRKYPQSIEVIAADGHARRARAEQEL